MITEKFKETYNTSRNGANYFCRNPLYSTFLYSDGVKELAETGCYWLLDILGTELPAVFKGRLPGEMLIVTIKVADTKAVITGGLTDDTTDYKRVIDYTDMPDGEWVLYVSDDGDGYLTCILPTEY